MVFWGQSASDIGSFIDKHSHTLLIDWPKLFRPKKETFVESVEVWNTYPLPTNALSSVLAIEWHNSLYIRDVSKDSLRYIVSRWILSYFSKLLCVSIAVQVIHARRMFVSLVCEQPV
jgi:hypothetical protein